MTRMTKVFVPLIFIVFTLSGAALYFSYVHQLKEKIAGKWCTKLEFVVKNIGEELRDQQAFLDNLIESERFLSQYQASRSIGDSFRSVENRIMSTLLVEQHRNRYALAIVDTQRNVLQYSWSSSETNLDSMFIQTAFSSMAVAHTRDQLLIHQGQLLSVISKPLPQFQGLALVSVLPITTLEEFEETLHVALPEGFSFDYHFLNEHKNDVYENSGASIMDSFMDHRTFDKHEMKMVKDFSNGVAFKHYDPFLVTSMHIYPENIAPQTNKALITIGVGTSLLALLTLAGVYLAVSRQIVRPLEEYTQQLEMHKRDSHKNRNSPQVRTEDPEYKSVFDRVKALVETDALTGVPNRSHFLQSLKIHLGQPSESTTYLMYMDVDRFKSVNDQYGHDIGDELLVKLSQSTRLILNQLKGDCMSPSFSLVWGEMSLLSALLVHQKCRMSLLYSIK